MVRLEGNVYCRPGLRLPPFVADTVVALIDYIRSTVRYFRPTMKATTPTTLSSKSTKCKNHQSGEKHVHETDLKPADAGRTSRQPTAKSMVDLRFDFVSRFAGQESMISGLDPHPTTGVPDNITSCPIELSSHNLTTVQIVSDVHISRPSWHRRQFIPADHGSMPCRSKSGKCPLLYACAPELYATS